MKKVKLAFLGAMIIGSGFMVSCNKEEVVLTPETTKIQQNEDLNLLTSVKKIENELVIQKLRTYVNNKSESTTSRNIEEFDFENAELVTSIENNLSMVIVQPLESSNNELSLMVGYNNSDFYGEPLLLNVENTASNVNVDFYDIDKELISTLVFDPVNEKVTSIPNISYKGKKGCGQATMDCVTDVYSNHGWASLAATITSAWIPQTVVVFAIACYDRNCR